jgi:hypothetical protein
MPCVLVGRYQTSEKHINLSSEDGVSMFLRNFGICLLALQHIEPTDYKEDCYKLHEISMEKMLRFVSMW